MIKMYGNKRNPTPIPTHYNQDTELIFDSPHWYDSTGGSHMGYGRWTSEGFLLKRFSLIIEDDKNEEYVKDIRHLLELDGMLEHNEGLESPDFTLCGDIYLHSPSTAGRLVSGHACNGLLDWKTLQGVSLKEIISKLDADR